MFLKIQEVIDKMDFSSISDSRKKELEILMAYIEKKKENNDSIFLNFICTHNSRRSQFSQLWAQLAAEYFGIAVQCYSGGVEVTAFNKRALASLERFGFKVALEDDDNPHCTVSWNVNSKPLSMFSKMYDDSINPQSNFAAIMTCSHADENCPVIIGCDERIAIRYDDPKHYDDTPLESAMYDYRSFEIGTEMFYIFSNIN